MDTSVAVLERGSGRQDSGGGNKEESRGSTLTCVNYLPPFGRCY